MARYRKGEYRTERRKRPVDEQRTVDCCQDGMGTCGRKDALAPCARCGKPFCGEHSAEHPRYCLGVG